MRLLLPFVLLSSLRLVAQDAYEEDFHVFTDAPRLLLTRQRLRLLQRERDRQSMRWQQFDTLVAGGAPMPEQGLAWALYYQVAEESNRQRAQGGGMGARRQAYLDARQLALNL